MSLLRYIAKRLLIFIPQLIAVTILTFLVVRLIPGNPAEVMAGGFATPEIVASIEEKMGLNEPLYTQYIIYMKNLIKGDMGVSWFTSNPVSLDIRQRFPATLELITIALFLALIIGITFGMVMAIKPKSIWDRIAGGYSLLAGSMPEFWVGLLLIYFLYVKLAVVPPPLGRLDVSIPPPAMITGAYTIDSILTGNWRALWSSISQLFLPVITLGFCFSPPIMKMTKTVLAETVNADYVWYAKACGLKSRTIVQYIVKNGLTPVITFVGILYGFLLGGAVLIEQVFGWGGIGQYAVQAVVNKDYLAIQGFMLISALWCMIIYLVVDIIYFMIDPRAKEG